MARPDSETRKSQLEIALLKSDLLEQQEISTTLQLGNARLENDIRELKRRLALADAVASVEVPKGTLKDLSGKSASATSGSTAVHVAEDGGVGGGKRVVDVVRSGPSIVGTNAVLPVAQGVSEKESLVTNNASKTPQSPPTVSLGSKKRKAELVPSRGPDRQTMHPNRKRTKTDSKETSSLELKTFSNVVNYDKEKPILSESRRAMFLQGATILTVNPEPLPTTWTRQFLNEVDGGSIIDLIAYSKDESRLFLFLAAEVNPWMPTSPGSSGLFLTFRKAMLEQPVTLMARVQQKPEKWMYFGEYSCAIAGQVAPQEFAQQDRKAKDRWVSLVCGSRWPEHEEILSRVLSWKREHSLDSTSSDSLRIGQEDIMSALEAGEVLQINVVRMDCVAYDHEFAEDLCTKLETWTPAAKKGKKRRAF